MTPITSSMGKRLLLHSGSNKSNRQYDAVINWDSCEQNKSEHSIPRVIESRSDQFKAQYLDWLYRFGKTKINNKSIVDHLLIRQDFSLWWMSLLFEKSKWKSPDLYQVFQLMALSSILKSIDDVDSIDVEISGTSINQSISAWCLDNNIRCNHIRAQNSKAPSIALTTQLFSRLPYMLQAIVWFSRHVILRKAKKIGNPRHKQTDKMGRSICFLSYFFNLDMGQITQGSFGTGYWTNLHKILSLGKAQVNWIHLFEKSNDCTNIGQASSLIDNLNRSSQFEFHTLVEQHISTVIVLQTLGDYFKGVVAGLKVNKQANLHFRLTEDGINFAPILAGDWRCSLFGKTAISGCLYLNIFEKIFKDFPIQEQGFYLLENQPWERSMVYAWKKNGHGRITGIPHTVVSYWDLRHFYSSKEYSESNIYMPNLVAVNGPFSERLYLNSGFPKDKLERVEALRYLYLSDMKSSTGMPGKDKTRMLVLGDCNSEITDKQIRFAIDCVKLADHRIELVVKPHPLSPVTRSNFPQVNFTVVTQPLNELESQYDIALASNPTAAAVDTYLSGKKTLIMLDCTSFNISPLRGCKDIHFVNKIEEVLVIMENFKPGEERLDCGDFFDLDGQLPKWKKILDL